MPIVPGAGDFDAGDSGTNIFNWLGSAVAVVGAGISAFGQLVGSQVITQVGNSISSFGEMVGSWGQSSTEASPAPSGSAPAQPASPATLTGSSYIHPAPVSEFMDTQPDYLSQPADVPLVMTFFETLDVETREALMDDSSRERLEAFLNVIGYDRDQNGEVNVIDAVQGLFHWVRSVSAPGTSLLAVPTDEQTDLLPLGVVNFLTEHAEYYGVYPAALQNYEQDLMGFLTNPETNLGLALGDVNGLSLQDVLDRRLIQISSLDTSMCDENHPDFLAHSNSLWCDYQHREFHLNRLWALKQAFNPPAEQLKPYQNLDTLSETFGFYDETEARGYMMSQMGELAGQALSPDWSQMSTLELAQEWRFLLRGGADRSQADVQTVPAFDEIERARQTDQLAMLEGHYESPDYTLLKLAASMLLEPVDWYFTGVDIAEAVAERRWQDAASNAFLLVVPLVSGQGDDAVDVLSDSDILLNRQLDDLFSNPLIDQRVTRPSVLPGSSAIPGGTRSDVSGYAAGSVEWRTTLREDVTAFTLRGDYGYDVIQNPTREQLASVDYTGPKDPDFIIEGRVFDQYTPVRTSGYDIAEDVNLKGANTQASRIVLDLTYTDAVVDEIVAELDGFQALGLGRVEEVIIMKDGLIVGFWLPTP